jgi:hypothetical protein
MAQQIVKRTSHPYLITSINGDPVVTIGEQSNALVTINGNLIVMGTQTSIESTNTAITDNIITLNAGLTTGNTVVPPDMVSGIEVDRGIDANTSQPAVKPQLIWSELEQRWMISGVNGVPAFISTQASGNNYLTRVVEDPSPALGGNLQVDGNGVLRTITSNVNVVIAPGINTQIDSTVQLKQLANNHIATEPVTGYSLLFAQIPKDGGSGVFVTNDKEFDQELITRRQSIIYSLIF